MQKKIIILVLVTLLISTTVVSAIETSTKKEKKENNKLLTMGSNSGEWDTDYWEETGNQFTASDGPISYYDCFGSSVALDGDMALIGSEVGGVYVYKQEGDDWIETQKITTSDPDKTFGKSLSLQDDHVLIGVTGDSYFDQSTEAYIYKHTESGWCEDSTLLNPSSYERNTCFGDSVALYGNYAIISAPGTSDDENWNGEAYIFKKSEDNEWILQQRLTPPDDEEDSAFGCSVDINENYAMVGAKFAAMDDGNCQWEGAVFVYKRTGDNWNQVQKLVDPKGATGFQNEFGRNICLSGNTLMVTAFYNKDVHIFELSGSQWKFKETLDDPVQFLGHSVEHNDEWAIIGGGAYEQGAGNLEDRGAIYIFRKYNLGWCEVQRSIASDAKDFASFGSASCIDGDFALVAAEDDDTIGQIHAGKVYEIKKKDVNQPYTPLIHGEDHVKHEDNVDLEEEYTFSVCTIEPQNQEVYYLFDWGDGTDSGWLGPYVSNEICQIGTSWSTRGYMPVRVKAKDNDSHESDWSKIVLITVGNDPPSIEYFTGPKELEVDEEGEFKVYVSDSGGDDIWLRINWEMENPNDVDWIGPYNSNEEITVYHTFDESFYDWILNIGITAKDEIGDESEKIHYRLIIHNDPPGIEVGGIIGPSEVVPGTEYTYEFWVYDYETDDVYLLIDWGDQTNSGWLGPYNPTSPDLPSANHIWDEKGSYMLKAKVKDEHDFESDWYVKGVTTSKNKEIGMPFIDFLKELMQNHPNIFPIIKQLLQRYV